MTRILLGSHFGYISNCGFSKLFVTEAQVAHRTSVRKAKPVRHAMGHAPLIIRLWQIFALFWLVDSYAVAEENQIFEHQAQIDIKLFGMDTTVPMRLSVSGEPHQSEHLLVRLSGDARPIIAGLPAYLEREVDARHRGCRERWDGRDASAGIKGSALSLQITVTVEKWLCEKIFGSDAKTKLASETGTIHALLAPVVSNGRLQIVLQGFSVSGLSDLSRELNVEGLLRDGLEAEIRKFNADEEATTLPSPWRENGYRLQRVALSEYPEPSLAVVVSGPNNAIALLSILKHLES